ncbi:DUF305 domain-containing protein [Micrococcus sp.]|uniref:DUF305 domain-containing protein n=1 Tax=Micrococcus sp. TaxID=1271 RepID=UPI002A91CF86|nr:DUF305 domain-containing protein [Micrococcus sp.]MDY6054619.1 DUF305 domain-containing protein [Micrococcus sp.]
MKIRSHTAPDVRPRRWSAAAGAGVLGLAIALTGCSAADMPAPSAASDASNTYLEGVLASPSRTSANPLAADIAFVRALHRNHDHMVTAAQILLDKRGVDGEVRSLAERVRDADEARMQDLAGRLEAWGADVPARRSELAGSPSASPSLPAAEQAAQEAQQSAEDIRAGLLTQGDWDALQAAEGEEAARVFLLQAHRLHQGAVTIAGTELDEGTDESARALAEQVRDEQGATMQRMVEMMAERGFIGAAPATESPSGFTGPIRMSGAGADGGTRNYTPSALQSLRAFYSRLDAVSPVMTPGSASPSQASATPSPTPADTARATPTPSR